MSTEKPREPIVRWIKAYSTPWPQIIKGDTSDDEVARAYKYDLEPMVKVIDYDTYQDVEHERTHYKTDYLDLSPKYDQALARITALRTALEFYADLANHVAIGSAYQPTRMHRDGGRAARQALAADDLTAQLPK